MTMTSEEFELELVQKDGLARDFGELLATGIDSDFIIKVPISFNTDTYEYQYKSIKVHKLILAARSPVLHSLIWKTLNESFTGELIIEDLSPQGLNVLLHYIYTGRLGEEWKDVPGEIVKASQTYGLPQLRDFVDRMLHSVCTKENALDLLNLARSHKLSQAYVRVGNYVIYNVREIVKSNGKGLKKWGTLAGNKGGMEFRMKSLLLMSIILIVAPFLPLLNLWNDLFY